ncbi:MAG TPA: hypothetical protein VMU86_03280 [Steroidobacteraceae bacterium]|nr:hypothetical protein [Steroidobacteraceae bacterium]
MPLEPLSDGFDAVHGVVAPPAPFTPPFIGAFGAPGFIAPGVWLPTAIADEFSAVAAFLPPRQPLDEVIGLKSSNTLSFARSSGFSYGWRR